MPGADAGVSELGSSRGEGGVECHTNTVSKVNNLSV
jgi:hypothetical protein